MSLLSIAGTIRSDVGLPEGIKLLVNGASSIDAVEKSIIMVENNLDDWTVGSGGLPNLAGEVELDASIMDGKTLKCGAVAGIRRHKNPISIARKIMEDTPHILLVGEGADQFADIIGAEKAELLTENARDIHRDFLEGKGLVEKPYDTPDALKSKGKYLKGFEKLVKDHNLLDWYQKYSRSNHGTVNVIAMDDNGNICCGVSTSGLSFKFPGRTGDSSIIGAGNYADNRFGAAACVGVGEIAIRLSLARIAVLELSKGKTVTEAAVNAIKSISNLEPDAGSMSILVMDTDGNVESAANFKDFFYWTGNFETMQPVKKDVIFVDIQTKDTGTPGYHR
ncbi:MAG: hypothetical protein A2161_03735 [Candidatus Schekmanbacteria bacterium RBG_13_48_7]|uniref:Asparaginase n=1 Tax=Candidatus Schekmanbacteria bacterium RBG_13_48_7 TaxID=1817878 RepID=A0A1F7RXB9_9BACT|nr:MAG: hypothetical protein A2161_03735 [Candidatus Schekmanbacteria bacterium RBG_13_48_7]